MKKTIYLFSVLVLCTMLFAVNVNANPFPTPDPIDGITFGADLDDSGLFSHSAQVLSIELFDFGDLLNSLGAGTVGTSFGFYFEGADVTDTSNLHGIFDINDFTSYPTLSQSAVIDFNQGKVFDVDAGLTEQSSFSGSGNIGFAFLFDPTYGVPILFTEPFLNPAGTDVSGTFPILGSGSPVDPYLITFNLDLGLDTYVIAAEVVSGITPVPEPGTLLLLSSGLAGIVFYRRKKR